MRFGDKKSAARVAILGAYDRFNYGDLLFPDVLEHVLREHNCERIDHYTTFKSDLRRLGGRQTRPMRDLFAPAAVSDGTAIIVAGGELLDADWTSTVETLLASPLAFLIRRLRNRFGGAVSDRICRRLSGAPMALPWVLSSRDFAAKVRVLYNCVGGSNVLRMSADLRAQLMTKLEEVEFVSVRDAVSMDVLQSQGLRNGVRLAPDCAVLVSRMYPREQLPRRVQPRVKAIPDRYPGGYFCFQINRLHGLGKAQLLAAQLRAVASRHGLGIVLLPVGRARNHEDHVPLHHIHDALGRSSEFVDGALSIHDIIFLIAHAHAYAGTSLHGAITSMSYAVPHIGLTQAIPKLAAFLKTWDIPEQQGCAALESLSDHVDAVLGVPRDRLEVRRDEVIRASLRNFDALLAAAGITAPAAATRLATS